MSDEPDREPIGEDARIDALDKRLQAAKEREEERGKPQGVVVSDANERMGNRVLGELIGGIAGGALIGWVIDLFVGRGHWGLIVMLFLGIVVAFRNIFRIANRRSDES